MLRHQITSAACMILTSAAVTVFAQSEQDEISATVKSINEAVASGILKTLFYETPPPAEPSSDEAVEGGDYKEELKCYLQKDAIVHCRYTFTSAYVSNEDLFWYRAGLPIYVQSTYYEMMTDTRSRSEVWLRNGTIVKWRYNDSNLHDADVFENIDEGHAEQLEKIMKLDRRMRELAAQSGR